MKPALIIALSCVLSIAAAMGTSLFLAPDEGDSRLQREEAMADRLRQVDALAARLQERVVDLDAAIARNERTATLLDSTGRSTTELERQLAELRDRLDSEKPASLQVTLPDGREFTTPEEALDRYLEARVQSEVQKRNRDQRRRDFDRFLPFAKMGFVRQVDRTAKRLNLDEGQTKRLRESVSGAFDKASPNFGVLFDPNSAQADRDSALVAVEDSFQGVTTEAQGYMDAEQVEGITNMQQQLSQGLTALQGGLGGLLGGAGAGAGPAGPTPPGTGGGSDL